MALKTMRAKLGDRWVALAYNAATGRYEGALTPPGTSIHQPGGYFAVEVQASNETGQTASITGAQLPALRLVVRETAAPALALVSPPPGYLNTGTPTLIFETVDEEGGSGVNPESFAVSAEPAAGGGGSSTWEEIPGGYRFSWSPPGKWADGPHAVTASVRDYDGNGSTISAAYIVDTVPPELLIRQPYQRHLVDDAHIIVAGEVWDLTAPPVTVTIGGEPVPVDRGRFKTVVPLEIGENKITITAVDGAGNRTRREVYLIRLVTDRTQADAEKVLDLCTRGYDGWTAEERSWWASVLCLRGSYDHRDLNRVGTAVNWLAGELRRRGYVADAHLKTDWADTDSPVQSQMTAYLSGVEAVRMAQGLYIPEIPGTVSGLTLDGANAIERALVEADAMIPHYTAWTAGEITCGGV